LETVIFFIHGFIIGILASMPVGAIAIMSVQRTMNNGLWAGFSIGMGAAFGDFVYAGIAGFSLNFISDFLLENKFWLALAGGIFLLFIGYKIYTSDTVKQFRNKKKLSSSKIANDFVSSFLLALSNPVTILGFTGFFASAGIISKDTSNFRVLILLIGVFLGATLWWFGISLIVNIFKKKITLRKIVIINRITGVLIVILGIAVLIGMFVFERKL